MARGAQAIMPKTRGHVNCARLWWPRQSNGLCTASSHQQGTVEHVTGNFVTSEYSVEGHVTWAAYACLQPKNNTTSHEGRYLDFGPGDIPRELPQGGLQRCQIPPYALAVCASSPEQRFTQRVYVCTCLATAQDQKHRARLATVLLPTESPTHADYGHPQLRSAEKLP